MQIQGLCFYRVEPFPVNMQVDKIKCRFTKRISSVVVLPALPGRI